MRFLALLLITTLACEQAASRTPENPGHPATAAKATTATGATAATTAATALVAATTDTTPIAPTGTAEVIALQTEPRPIRALYVNRFAAQSATKMRHLIAIADSTEINAFVIDIKDEFGLNWHSSDPLLQRNEGKMGKVANLPALVDTLRAHGILPIARMVVFKDSVAARNNPDHVIRKADGTPWRDKKGVTWVNPYSRAIWDYNFRVADEAVKMGFGEIQFDYVRFPEPYKSLPPQVFPEAAGRSKADALNDLLKTARARYNKMGVRMTADIFGLVTTVRGPLEVGQDWEKISPVVDVVLPMVYPSLYPHGAFGIRIPNAEPHKTIFIAITSARTRDAKLGITTPEHVRPWLQAFTLGAPHYGPAEIEAQKQAVYDAGYDGWVLWNPGSKYDEFLPALAKNFESHKKSPPLPLPPHTPID
jgi:hypothetical protein